MFGEVLQLSFNTKISPEDWGHGPLFKLVEKIHIILNPHSSIKKPKMNYETRIMLDDFYRSHNQGLADMIGNPMVGTWHE